jgi:reactive intermediate/imine deaminase
MRRIHMNPDTVAPPVGSYSHVVRVEAADTVWLHVSGQIALDVEGNLIGSGDIGAQTEQVFENLRAILEANGATFDDVVKLQTFVTSFGDLAAMREIRLRYLTSEPPASTTVQVVALVLPEAMIEVDLVAAIPA